MEPIPPPPPNKPRVSTWLPTSITSGFKARTKPRSLVSLAHWFNNEHNYDLVVSTTADPVLATDPQHHFKCHQFVIHTRSEGLLRTLLEHRIGLYNHVPVVYLPELVDQPDLLGYLLRLLYDDLLIDQEDQFQALLELYKRYDMCTLLYALDPQLLSDTQRTRHSQLLASDLTRVTPQCDHVTPFSDCRVTIDGVAGTYYGHSIVLRDIATIFESRDSSGQYAWIIRARDIHALLEGREAALLPCLDVLIRYFYSGSVTLNGLDSEQLLGLSLIAAHYGLTGVKERCESRLTSHVTAENACQLLLMVHRYHVTHLQTEILNLMSNMIPAVANSLVLHHVPPQLWRDYRSGPLNVFHCCLNAHNPSSALKTLREYLGVDAVPLLTAVIDGSTLLHRAVEREDMSACQALVGMHVIDLEARNAHGLTVLQVLLNSRRFSLSLLCDLLNAGVSLDYLTEQELLMLLKLIPKLHHYKTSERRALKRLIELYHTHSAQPWMSLLWTDECVLSALAATNFDCVGLLWTHFNQPLCIAAYQLRAIDPHHVVLSLYQKEYVIDMRVAKFRIEEKLVWYGAFDDLDYNLHITTHEGPEISIDNVRYYDPSDEFLNLLKFMLIINRAAPEDYDRLFSMSFGKLIELMLTSTAVHEDVLEDYFISKCNIQ